MTPALFRQQFPEFKDPGSYSDVAINLWIGVAGNLLNASRWGSSLDFGTALFVAHHLAIAARDQAAALAGGIPGAVSGPVTAKSAGPVSSAHDTAAVTMTDGAFWNATTYGVRFLQLSRYMGAGGTQLS